MAPRHLERKVRYDAPPDALVALYTNPEFLVAEAHTLGAFSAEVEVVSEGDGHLELRVDQVTPNRDPRTRNKEAAQSIHYAWDLGARTCRWWRTTPKPDGVDIRGTHRAEADGDGCMYTLTWDLQVSVPVVGRVITKRLAAGVLEATDARAALVRQWLARG